MRNRHCSSLSEPDDQLDSRRQTPDFRRERANKAVVVALRCHGLTLLELLIVLSIVALLIGQALPSFADSVQRKRANLTMKNLNQLITAARSTAVSSGSMVTLCRSRNGVECGGRWSDGVMIFIDTDGDRKIDLGQQVLRYRRLENAGGDLYWRSFGNRQYLQFTARGFTNNQNGNFTYCPESGDRRFARQLIVNRSGRTRRAIDSNLDGIVEDSRGRPVRC